MDRIHRLFLDLVLGVYTMQPWLYNNFKMVPPIYPLKYITPFYEYIDFSQGRLFGLHLINVDDE